MGVAGGPEEAVVRKRGAAKDGVRKEGEVPAMGPRGGGPKRLGSRSLSGPLFPDDGPAGRHRRSHSGVGHSRSSSGTFSKDHQAPSHDGPAGRHRRSHSGVGHSRSSSGTFPKDRQAPSHGASHSRSLSHVQGLSRGSGKTLSHSHSHKSEWRCEPEGPRSHVPECDCHGQYHHPPASLGLAPHLGCENCLPGVHHRHAAVQRPLVPAKAHPPGQEGKWMGNTTGPRPRTAPGPSGDILKGPRRIGGVHPCAPWGCAQSSSSLGAAPSRAPLREVQLQARNGVSWVPLGCTAGTREGPLADDPEGGDLTLVCRGEGAEAKRKWTEEAEAGLRGSAQAEGAHVRERNAAEAPLALVHGSNGDPDLPGDTKPAPVARTRSLGSKRHSHMGVQALPRSAAADATRGFSVPVLVLSPATSRILRANAAGLAALGIPSEQEARQESILRISERSLHAEEWITAVDKLMSGECDAVGLR